jgi:hypothetical protein
MGIASLNPSYILRASGEVLGDVGDQHALTVAQMHARRRYET